MPTKFNLSIDSRTSDDMSGEGITQNTNVRSDDPNELIAILQKLSGVSPAAHAHEEPAAAPTVHVAAQEMPAGAMRAIMQKSGIGALPGHEHEEAPCGCDAVMEEKVDEALANAPKPKTMKNLLDIVNTDHTASTPNKVTKAGHGDNPLPESEDELMESRLMQEWKETKIQHYADELNMSAVGRAITEGAESFVDGTREYAVRTQDGFVKIYPVIENRVMTQVPVYVMQEGADIDWKQYDKPPHMRTGDKKNPVDRGVPRRDPTITPARQPGMATHWDDPEINVPTLQRMKKAGYVSPEINPRPRKPPARTFTEQDESSLSLRDMWNRYSRHHGTEKDAQEDSEARARAKHEALQVVIAVTDEYGPEAAADMKRYANHKLAYDNTGDRRHDDAALELLDKYSFNKPSDEVAPLDHADEKTAMSEAKRKKNKYAIGMAAAMKATGDKPPLEKSTITKAHEIARAVKEGSKKK